MTTLLATALLSGCSHTSAVTAPRSEAQRYARARPVAIRFVRLLAARRSVAALESPADDASRASLTAVAQWFDRVPLSRLRVIASDVPVSQPDAAGVLLTLSGRLGSDPPSVWMDMGQLALAVRDTGSGWRVARDISSGAGLAVVHSGLAAVPAARYTLGRRCVVIDTTERDRSGARLAAATADVVAPTLAGRYGGGAAIQRPVIVLVQGWPVAQAIADASFWHEALGEERQGLIFVDDPVWQTESTAFRRALVVHELTHVATARIVRGAPESLVEGVARYEEDAFLRRLGDRWPLTDLARAYSRRYPSEHRWTQRSEQTWGLSGSDAIALAYDDGFAVVRTVIVKYGGVPALRRLGAAFRRRESGGDFSEKDVQIAFRSALGVSFGRVLDGAHAFARAGR